MVAAQAVSHPRGPGIDGRAGQAVRLDDGQSRDAGVLLPFAAIRTDEPVRAELAQIENGRGASVARGDQDVALDVLRESKRDRVSAHDLTAVDFVHHRAVGDLRSGCGNRVTLEEEERRLADAHAGDHATWHAPAR